MPEDKKKSWFRRHKILTGIGGFFALLIVIGIFQGIGDGVENAAKYSDYSQNGLIVASSNVLLPQDSEIDRIWEINDIKSTNTNATGFIDGAERKISKVEDLSGSSIIMKSYRFDSGTNANQFYNQEKQKIDVRGVEEWNLGSDCFGIEISSFLSGSVEGLCLRNNVIFYIESASTSYEYASDGKEFMKIMLNKV